MIKPVAVFGPNYEILYVSRENLPSITKRHNITVGDVLYAESDVNALINDYEARIAELKLFGEQMRDQWKQQRDIARMVTDELLAARGRLPLK